MALAVLGSASGCAEPSAAAAPLLSVSATLELLPNGVSRLVFIGRNDGNEVVHLSGCPSAPAFYLDSQLGAWFEVVSVGVVCPANLVTERLAIGPGTTVSGSFSVATPGTYRFRLLVDNPRGGGHLTIPSNALVVR